MTNLLTFDEPTGLFREPNTLLTQVGQELIAALRGPIYPDEVKPTDQTCLRVERIADRLYETDARGRTLDEIYRSVAAGEWGECAIASRLRNRGLPVVENDENKSLEYHWDLMVHGRKVEIKRQTAIDEGQTRTCFSVDDLEKIKHAKEKWSSYDFLLAFIDGPTNSVIPWLLMDSKVLSQEAGYFGPSNYKGWFVKTGKAHTAGLSVQLNMI